MVISELRTIDQILVLAFIMFAATIVTLLIIVSHEAMREWFLGKVIDLTDRIERFNERMNDDERFDSNWMDYSAWKETRLQSRRRI